MCIKAMEMSNEQPVSTLNGCFIIVSGLSTAVLHHPIHQHVTKWECGVSKGMRCGLQQIRVHQFYKVMRGIKMLVIRKMQRLEYQLQSDGKPALVRAIQMFGIFH
jgi:hypothetical protein